MQLSLDIVWWIKAFFICQHAPNIELIFLQSSHLFQSTGFATIYIVWNAVREAHNCRWRNEYFRDWMIPGSSLIEWSPGRHWLNDPRVVTDWMIPGSSLIEWSPGRHRLNDPLGRHRLNDPWVITNWMTSRSSLIEWSPGHRWLNDPRSSPIEWSMIPGSSPMEWSPGYHWLNDPWGRRHWLNDPRVVTDWMIPGSSLISKIKFFYQSGISCEIVNTIVSILPIPFIDCSFISMQLFMQQLFSIVWIRLFPIQKFRKNNAKYIRNMKRNRNCFVEKMVDLKSCIYEISVYIILFFKSHLLNSFMLCRRFSI